MSETFALKLYVAGKTPKAVRAFANLRKICDEHLEGPLQHRGHRPGRESAARARRPDPGAADAGAPPADADQENHRRSVQHRTRARGSRPATTPAQRVNESFTQALGENCETETFELRLYVTGMTPRSTRAITAVRAMCEELLRGRYDLEIIDVYQQPALEPARTDRRHADADQEGPRAATPAHR